jgi:hypothetical protein
LKDRAAASGFASVIEKPLQGSGFYTAIRRALAGCAPY